MKQAIIYASPTGGCAQLAFLLHEITLGDLKDITMPKDREALKDLDGYDLVYIILPVYGQTITKVLKQYIYSLKISNNIVLIGVYGNIAYGGALKHLAKGIKANLIAAAYFIATHSYNNPNLNLGVIERDNNDTEKLLELVRLVNERINSGVTIKLKGRSNLFAIMFPRLVLNLSSKPPKAIKTCLKCEKCMHICPYGAIRSDFSIDGKKCEHCYKCVNICMNRKKRISLITKLYLKRKNKVRKAAIIF